MAIVRDVVIVLTVVKAADYAIYQFAQQMRFSGTSRRHLVDILILA